MLMVTVYHCEQTQSKISRSSFFCLFFVCLFVCFLRYMGWSQGETRHNFHESSPSGATQDTIISSSHEMENDTDSVIYWECSLESAKPCVFIDSHMGS